VQLVEVSLAIPGFKNNMFLIFFLISEASYPEANRPSISLHRRSRAGKSPFPILALDPVLVALSASICWVPVGCLSREVGRQTFRALLAVM
jgi:hypothetical protein